MYFLVFQRAMNREQERFCECPVCGLGLAFHFLHEHYAAHFQKEKTRASECIKEGKASESSVVNASSTSTELPQKQQQEHIKTIMSKRTASNENAMVDGHSKKVKQDKTSILENEANKEVKQEKASILENEANARSLAKNKVTYSRRGEEDDTLIIRDLYTYARFDHFGVKGIDQLEQIFHVILGMLSENRTTLLTRMRFGGDALRELLDGLSDEDQDGMRAALNDFKKVASIKIELKKLETCPQLELLQYNEDKSLENGIYLYVAEVVKLLKHMNSVFAFSKSACLSFVKAAPIQKYTDDNFF